MDDKAAAVCTTRIENTKMPLAAVVRLYLLLIGARIRSQMQYKFSFVSELIGNLVATGIDFVVILVLFQHIDALAGWKLPEVGMLYGITALSFALSELFFDGFDHFNGMVRSGQFDTVLIRPMGDFMQVMSSEFVLRRLGRLLQSIIVLSWSVSQTGVSFDAADILLLAGTLVSGLLVYASLLILQGTACFWTVESLEIFNILTYGGTELLSHPLDIFGRFLRKFFIFIIPMAFTNYVPAALILGKKMTDGIPREPGWFSPLVGPIIFCITLRAWKFGVKHYQSTGN